MKTRLLVLLFLTLLTISTIGANPLRADDVMDDDLSPCKNNCEDDYQDCVDNNADSSDCDDPLAQCKEECDSE